MACSRGRNQPNAECRFLWQYDRIRGRKCIQREIHLSMGLSHGLVMTFIN